MKPRKDIKTRDRPNKEWADQDDKMFLDNYYTKKQLKILFQSKGKGRGI